MPDTSLPAIRFALVPELDGALREQFARIFYQSFPPNERESLERIDGRLAENGARLHGAFAGGDLVGFALVLPLEVEGVWLLDYLAVADRHRNHGLGRAFLAHLRAELGAEAGASGILLELESDQWGTEEERYLRARRAAFYRRNGAVPVPLSEHLRMPAMDGTGPIYTKLMWLPLADPLPAGEKLVRCVRSFLAQAYGLSDEDPTASQALRLLQA